MPSTSASSPSPPSAWVTTCPERPPGSPTGPSTRCWSQPTSSWAWSPWCWCCRLSAACPTCMASQSSSCCPPRARLAPVRKRTIGSTFWAPSQSHASNSLPVATLTTPPSPGSWGRRRGPKEAGLGPRCPRDWSRRHKHGRVHPQALVVHCGRLTDCPPLLSSSLGCEGPAGPVSTSWVLLSPQHCLASPFSHVPLAGSLPFSLPLSFLLTVSVFLILSHIPSLSLTQPITDCRLCQALGSDSVSHHRSVTPVGK